MNRLEKTNSPSSFYDHLKACGLIHNETPNIRAYFEEQEKSGQTPNLYIGFDPSAPSLQAGNLLAILLLRRAQLFGIRPIAVLGGATGLIGDPSGKKAERNLMAKETAEHNLNAIKAQIASIVDPDCGDCSLQFANNMDWFQDFKFIDFLRDVGKHITVNYMIAKESVKQRMDTGISYAEFGYMLVQGYDFLSLFECEKCLVQLGGSDQWGNMTTGIELIRRKHQKEAHALSAPLLTDAAGNKLGKTEGGAIFLDASMTSAYQFFQYWLNQPDVLVPNLLKKMTLLSGAEIQRLETAIQENPAGREAQRTLATELTTIVHGESSAKATEAAAKVLFSKDPAVLESLEAEGWSVLAGEVPSTQVSGTVDVALLDLMVQSELVKSKGEARRLIKSNAVSINRQKISDEAKQVTNADFQKGKFLLLGVGKAKLHLVYFS